MDDINDTGETIMPDVPKSIDFKMALIFVVMSLALGGGAGTALSGGVSVDQFAATKTIVETNSERIQRLEAQERASSIEFGELRRDIRHFGEKLDNIGISLERMERDNRRERGGR